MKRLLVIFPLLLIACSSEHENEEEPQPNYMRKPTSNSFAGCTRIFDFVQAPGQFVNDAAIAGQKTEQTNLTNKDEAIEWANTRIFAKTESFISLGAWGGYIVVGFDHSIARDNKIAVQSNTFKGSSEPGIVYVSRDENGNGLPDDKWYMIDGSSKDVDTDYEVTYYRPDSAKKSVQWVDKYGNKGEIDYLEAYHKQDYYYPSYIPSDSLTLRGACLMDFKPYDKSDNGSYWVNPEYDFGYSDNYGKDLVKQDKRILNILEIPSQLDYIDFVKVQTGAQAKAGWLGENSTEFLQVYDWKLYQEIILENQLDRVHPILY